MEEKLSGKNMWGTHAPMNIIIPAKHDIPVTCSMNVKWIIKDIQENTLKK